jgi:MSHA biogenesis protein MshE
MSQRSVGDLLLRAGVVTENQLAVAQQEQKQGGGRLGAWLVHKGFVTEDALVAALAQALQMPRAPLGPHDPVRVPAKILERIERGHCERHAFVPFGYVAERTALQVAVADPALIATLDELGRRLGLRVETMLAGETQIQQTIARVYGSAPGASSTPSSSTLAPAVAATLAATATTAQRAPDELRAAAEQQRRAARALAELLVERGVLDPSVLQRARS